VVGEKFGGERRNGEMGENENLEATILV